MAAQTAAPTIPFPIASQYSSRASFQVATQTLAAAAPTPITPIQVPAVGYLDGILIEVTITGTAGTTPAYAADGPFNVIQSINFRNAGGTNLIPPVTGYQAMLMNKYGGQIPGIGPWSDPRFGAQFNAPANVTTTPGHFFLWIPIGIDISDALGLVPALASNANYQVELTLAAQSLVTTSNPVLTVAIATTAYFYDLPAETDANGVHNQTVPDGQGTASIWQIEQPNVAPGTQLVQSNNVGNVIRNHILVLRNAAGARIDVTNGWPNLMEVYLDNQPRFAFRRTEWEFLMSRWFGLGAATKDSVGGLDTGVYVIPYHAMTGSVAGDPANTRAQLLPTLNATLLQFRAQDWGSAVSKLEILTQVVSTKDPALLFSK